MRAHMHLKPYCAREVDATGERGLISPGIAKPDVFGALSVSVVIITLLSNSMRRMSWVEGFEHVLGMDQSG
jgi:hypothetical protein